MRPRTIDWLLFVIVTFAVISGFTTFLVGRPDGQWLFVVHGMVGLALLLLLYWKLRRVVRRLVEPKRWDKYTFAALLALAAVLLTIVMGLVWTTWPWPLGYPNGMNWHVILGLCLALFMTLHLVVRFKPLRIHDLKGRRTALNFLAMVATGGVLWQTHEAINRGLNLPGARRRFTGSRPLAGVGANAFPVTMWMLDNPVALNIEQWQLRVDGAVATPQTLSYQTLLTAPSVQIEAILDCTSGWYTKQTWQGVSVGWLLDQVQPAVDAVTVSFISVTGYRWSLPLEEARHALLATHIGGQPLDHGHGAPVRLVAPGRRGFQWVKWVAEIQLLTATDHGQWVAIFTSGIVSSQ